MRKKLIIGVPALIFVIGMTVAVWLFPPQDSSWASYHYQTYGRSAFNYFVSIVATLSSLVIVSMLLQWIVNTKREVGHG